MSAEQQAATPPHPGQDSFIQLLGILIASVAVLATIAGFLHIDASARSGQQNREAQRLAVQASGEESRGRIKVAYDWQSAFQLWAELDLLAQSAEFDYEDTLGAARYRTVRDETARFSDFLIDPQFFDPQTGTTQLSAYEAQTYVQTTTELSERRAAQADIATEWSKKADTYVIHLTLLATTLFLLGLSATVHGLTRRLFVGVGGVISALAVLWMALVALHPLPNVHEEAIGAYARGAGLAYAAQTSEAIDEFGKALEADPAYANALHARGNARSSAGVDRELEGSYDESQDLYTQAVQDYEAAQAAGRDDTSVGWNLGWVYYLTGRLDDAVDVDREVLDRDPDLLGVRTNLALALLARGDVEDARTEYERAEATLADAARERQAAQAAGEESPVRFWSHLFYAELGARDLQSLLDRLDGRRAWTEAPTPKLVDTEAVNSAGPEFATRLKEMALALEETGEPPPPAPEGVVIECFGFGAGTYDDSGQLISHTSQRTFPEGTREVVVAFDYAGMRSGLPVVFRVYRNGRDQPSLRLRESWSLAESGSAFNTGISYAYSNRFVLAQGEYDIEMYVDYHLVKKGSFYILADNGSGSANATFFDDFSDPDSGWNCHLGEDATTDYEDGAYRILVNQAGSRPWSNPGRNFSDVHIEVDATKAGGPDDNAIGVMCRYLDGNNYYTFTISSDGFAGIAIVKDGQSTVLTGDGFLERSEAIEQGEATNHIRADCIGDTLSLYVNGELVERVRDSSFSEGDLGLFAGAYDTPGTDILFDDFDATAP